MKDDREDIVTPGEFEQLLTVRAMLEGAQRAVAYRSPIDGITPTVLLDAVAERATHLVAVSLGMRVGPRDGVDELTPKIADELAGAWRPRTLPEIRQLHRARNSAQHEGLSPDATQLPGWAIAVDAFVRSIVDARFAVDLDRVALSDAIHDAKLRERIVAAGRHRDAGDFAACVRGAREAVADAAKSWRLLHGGRRSAIPSSRYGLSELVGGDPLISEVKRLVGLSDLTAFARDAADAAWFDALAGVADHLLDQDDAERALGFATWWVIGYEGASSNWVADRQHRRDVAMRQVRADDRSARIDSVVSLEQGAVFKGWDLTVRLADVPAEADWQDWSTSVASLLRPPERGSGPQWFVYEDGTARIHGVDSGTVGPELERLDEALRTADGEATATANQAAAEEDARQAEDREYEQAVIAAGPRPTWVLGIRPVRAAWGRDLRFTRLDVDHRALRIPVPPPNSLVWQVIEAIPHVGDIQNLGGKGLEIRSVVDPKVLVDVLNKIDPQVQEALTLLAEQQDERDAETAKVRGLAVDAIARLRPAE